MLSGLFPDRIDLAVGRAPGTDATTMFALQRDRRQAAPDDFPEQLAELLVLSERRAARRSIASRASSTLPGRPGAPGALAARLVAAKRHLGGGARPALRVRGLHQSGGRRVGGPVSPELRALAVANRRRT